MLRSRLAARRLAPLAAFACAGARGDTAALARAVRAARAAGWPRRALEEVGLMLVLYAGYPAALEALRDLLAAWPGRARAVDQGTRASWRARGRALCRRVYGSVYPVLVRRVAELHPDLARWMEETGYGRVLARPGLGARERELITVAVLAQGGWERQLVSHLLGAARLGATPAEIRRAASMGARRARGGDRVARRAWRAAFGMGARARRR